MKALIEENGRVAQIVENDKTFPVAPLLHWRTAPAGVTTQHTYDGANFIAPEPMLEPDLGPDPIMELDLALETAFAKIEAASTLAEVKLALIIDLKKAMLGHIAGRR